MDMVSDYDVVRPSEYELQRVLEVLGQADDEYDQRVVQILIERHDRLTVQVAEQAATIERLEEELDQVEFFRRQAMDRALDAEIEARRLQGALRCLAGEADPYVKDDEIEAFARCILEGRPWILPPEGGEHG